MESGVVTRGDLLAVESPVDVIPARHIAHVQVEHALGHGRHLVNPHQATEGRGVLIAGFVEVRVGHGGDFASGLVASHADIGDVLVLDEVGVAVEHAVDVLDKHLLVRASFFGFDHDSALGDGQSGTDGQLPHVDGSAADSCGRGGHSGHGDGSASATDDGRGDHKDIAYKRLMTELITHDVDRSGVADGIGNLEGAQDVDFGVELVATSLGTVFEQVASPHLCTTLGRVHNLAAEMRVNQIVMVAHKVHEDIAVAADVTLLLDETETTEMSDWIVLDRHSVNV